MFDLKNRVVILLISVLLIICAVVCILITSKEQTDDAYERSFFVSVAGDENQIRIYPFKQTGNMYIFLPSYAEMNNVAIHTKEKVYIGENRVKEGESCAPFELDREYDITVNGKPAGKIQFMRSANIACLYIDTISGSMKNIYNDKENKERIRVKLINASGEIDYSGDNDKLKGRGNSTWREFDKKPFSLNLKKPRNLLGLGFCDNWELLANSKDITNVKNKSALDTARDLGLYAPASEYVDLYLNGEYNGLYLLTENVRAAVDDPGITDGDGSYLFVRDWSVKKHGFTTETGQHINIKYPKAIGAPAIEKLKTELKEMEDALGSDASEDGKWTEYIDIDSWAKKYLIEEIFANSDAVFASQYFVWRSDTDKKIIAGPAWDYDGILKPKSGNKNPGCFYCNRMAVNNNAPAMYWYNALYGKKEFKERLIDIYKNLFLPRLDSVYGKMDELADYTASSASMDRLRWRENHNGKSVESALADSKKFLSEHIAFLNSAWVDGVNYHTVIFDRGLAPSKTWFSYVFYTCEDGKSFEDMPSNSELYMPFDTVWYNKKTGELFDRYEIIKEDTVLCTKPDKGETDEGETEKAAPVPMKSKFRGLINGLIKYGPGSALIIILIILIAADLKRRGRKHGG